LADGLIVFTKTGMPNYKRYLDASSGSALQSLWMDVNPLNPQAIERLDYPTQKPEALLERIIKASSNPGDLVADFFCGSGTTLAVAERLGRRWLGCDLGRFAIHTTRKRLIGVQRQLKEQQQPYRSFEILNLGHYERQHYFGIDHRLTPAQQQAQAAQFDLTATPKHTNGSIFFETVSDYPLVEAIHQCVVKKPVLPDAESRNKLRITTSNNYAEEHRDYIDLGYREWQKAQARVSPSGRKAVLFIMTDTTAHADDVGEYLQKRYPEFEGSDTVLVIHTKANGELSETAANENELRKLRQRSNNLDQPGDKCVAVVSVMMLREGWDVQSVCTIVGLRAFTTKSNILPEQTLGRGLRLMFRNDPPQGGPEEVSVVGVETFMKFVEEIKAEGVELNYVPMGRATRPKAPSVVQLAPEHSGLSDPLDIALPVLEPRIYYDYASLDQLDPASLPRRKPGLKQYGADAPRTITFVHSIEDNKFSHDTVLDSSQPTDYHSVLGFFARTIMEDARLDKSHYPTIYGKLKQFVQNDMFIVPVDLTDVDTLRNLAEFEASQLLRQTFAAAIKSLVVRERETTAITHYFRMSKVKPYQINGKDWFVPQKSIFDKVACDNDYEMALAKLLDGSDAILSFARNPARTGFGIEYLHSTDGIPNYYPDFIVKQTEQDIWLVEFKGREDDDDKQKKARLEQWCADATALADGACRYHPLFIRQSDWIMYPPTTFADMCKLGV